MASQTLRNQRVTLDGEPAKVHCPEHGKCEISTTSGRMLRLPRDKTYAILKSGGQFESPAFARPANLRAQV